MSDFESAFQAALTAEYQAVFGYALLGPHLPEAEQGRALSCETAHEAIRDAALAAMAAASIKPDEPAADYPTLYPVGSASQAYALAARLEDDCAQAWRVLYLSVAVDGGSAPPDATARRRDAQAALTSAAVRAARWRKIAGVVPASQPFPGI